MVWLYIWQHASNQPKSIGCDTIEIYLVVSFDVVFPPFFGDFLLIESILHPTAADTSFSVMVLQVSCQFRLNYNVVTIICCVSVSHDPSFNVGCLPCHYINRRKHLLQLNIFIKLCFLKSTYKVKIGKMV